MKAKWKKIKIDNSVILIWSERCSQEPQVPNLDQ